MVPLPRASRRFFEFGPTERADIDRHRDDTARLGYAARLGCVWFLGCFPDLTATPSAVIDHVAAGLGVRPQVFAGYADSRTGFAHAVEIRAR